MPLFKSKPTVVEAEQFFASGNSLPFEDGPVVCYDDDGCWYVKTIHEERAYLEDGDWVILEPGSKDRAYPCKPGIFAARYEPFQEETLAGAGGYLEGLHLGEGLETEPAEAEPVQGTYLVGLS